MIEFGAERLAAGVEPPDPRERTAIAELLGRLARPRLCGTSGATAVETCLKGEFQRLGYELRELPFSFSSIPGRWGVPAMGALVAVGGSSSAVLAGLHHGAAALLVLLATAGLIGLGVRSAATLIRRLPWGRIETANWLVIRPGARPRYLVTAHRDSKSQAVPLYGRATGIAGGLIALPALLLLDVVALLGPAAWNLWPAAAVIGVAIAGAGGILLFCTVGNDSPGALDNGSGLAALVGLAARERSSPDVAFMVTDGEELGLAGACAVCRRLPPVFGVINLDGLDDAGEFQIIDRHGLPRRGVAPHLVAALLAAAQALGMDAKRRSLPVGVLVDHIPFADAGLSAVTVMRGRVDSLKRVHLRSDDTGHLTGEGAARAVALVSAALALLRAGA